MDKIFWAGILMGIIVVVGGFLLLPIETEIKEVEPPAPMIKQDIVLVEEWAPAGEAEPGTGETKVVVEVVAEEAGEAGGGEDVAEGWEPAEQTNEEKVLEYLNAHPVEDFKDTAARFKSIEMIEETAHISYYTSTADPYTESFYWMGVAYKAIPEAEKVWAYGYNLDDILMVNSKRYHPGREGYFFDQYRWFEE